MLSILNFLLLLTLFFTPLIPQIGELGWEQIKVIFFIIITTLAGCLWLGSRPKIKWTGIKLWGLGLLGILGVTSVMGVDPQASFLGRPPYFQGFIFYADLFLFFLMVSSVAIKLEQVALALIGSATIVFLVAIQDWVLLNVFNQPLQAYAGRVISTFGQPNFYAGFLLLTLPFSYLLFKNPRILQGHTLSTQGVTLNNKLSYFGLFSGLISILGIFVSYSRSAILMALMLLILGLIDQLKNKIRIGVVVFGVVFISMMIALAASSGVVGNEVSLPILTKDPDLTKESVEKRVYIWPEVFKIALQKPLTGYGLENIEKTFVDYFETNKHLFFEENLKISPVLISLKELTIDRSHNYPLDLLLFSGLLGLLGWLGLIGVLLIKLYQNIHDPASPRLRRASRKQNVLLVSLLTYLVWIQFQNQSIAHLIYFWLLAGIVDQKWG